LIIQLTDAKPLDLTVVQELKLKNMVNILTSANFIEQVIHAKKPVLVVFGADWCSSCRMINPEIKALHKHYMGQAVIAQVDVDREPDLAKRYGVNHIPALLFFRDGLIIDHHTGAIPLAMLSEKLSRIAINSSTTGQFPH
jgi:thioredoxin 1